MRRNNKKAITLLALVLAMVCACGGCKKEDTEGQPGNVTPAPVTGQVQGGTAQPGGTTESFGGYTEAAMLKALVVFHLLFL